MTRFRDLAEEGEWHIPQPHGLPSWLLSCKAFLHEGLEVLRLNSTPMYGLSTRGHGPGYKDTALIEPLTRDSRLYLLDRTIFIERKDFEFDNRYTFWTRTFREIETSYARFQLFSRYAHYA